MTQSDSETRTDGPNAPFWRRPANVIRALLVVVALVASLLLGPGVRTALAADKPGLFALWAFLPIAVYAVLALVGLPILPTTLAALATAVVLDAPSLSEAGSILAGSVTNVVTLVGVIIAVGAGLGAILGEAGVAQLIVHKTLQLFGSRGMRWSALGLMASCAVLVAALGTLAGALAVAAPLLVPAAARLGYTRGATACLMFIGGCAGLALAPFGGTNVAIMEAAHVGYGTYLLAGAGLLCVVSLVVGMLWIPVVQRRGAAAGDFYSDDEATEEDATLPAGAHRATIAFVTTLVILIVVGAFMNIGIVFPLIALPILALVAGFFGRVGWRRGLSAGGRAIVRMAPTVLLFWLLAVAFEVFMRLNAFDALLHLVGPRLESSTAFMFAIVVALVGWLGVPGAAAVQVVLISEVFGPIGSNVGLSAAAWVTVLLFASKADSYGPFPTPNMVTPMGMARSTNLRTMLVTGWVVLVPVLLLYVALLYMETR